MLTLVTPIIWAGVSNDLKIVTSIKPLKLIAAEIAGSEADITVLLKPGSSPHNYQLRPSHARAISDADLIIWIGPSLERFMKKIIRRQNEDANIITTEDLAGIQTHPYRSNALWEESHHDHGHDHHHHSHDIDGHLWLSPNNGAAIATSIANHLIKIAPQNKTQYEANLASLLKKIDAVDKENQEALMPHKKTAYLVYHDAFQYFEKHYGLNAIGTFTTENTSSLSAKRLSVINKTINASNIKCIFADEQYNAPVVQRVADQTGVTLVSLDPMGSSISHSENGYTQLLKTIRENMLSCFK